MQIPQTPLMQSEKIVLFDGVCVLCNAWAKFLIKYDKRRTFKLASVQSEKGQALLRQFGYPTDHFNTMLLIEGDQAYQRSAAFIRIIARMQLPWKLAAILWIIPAPLRDWLYDRVALNRARLSSVLHVF